MTPTLAWAEAKASERAVAVKPSSSSEENVVAALREEDNEGVPMLPSPLLPKPAADHVIVPVAGTDIVTEPSMPFSKLKRVERSTLASEMPYLKT